MYIELLLPVFFLTAILHRGLRNCFSRSFTFTFHILFELLFLFFIWNFVSLVYLDFPIFFSIFFHFLFQIKKTDMAKKGDSLAKHFFT